MTDEEKKECKCECYKIAAKFLLLTTSVFGGTLLAIIFAAHLLKPPFPPCNCHKGMHKMPPRMERRLPYGPMMHHKRMPQSFHRNGQFPQGQMKFERRNFEFQGPKPDFTKRHIPQRPQFGVEKTPSVNK